MASARDHTVTDDDPDLAGGHRSDREQHERLDRAELLRFVERFAIVMTHAGLARMPARVFSYVLIDDADRYTAAELATALQVSPAAISGAVRTLVQAGLLGREREPGARVDTYRVYDDNLWQTIMRQSWQTAEPVIELADEGVRLLGRDTPGGRRMLETREFYRFLGRRLASLMVEWEAYRSEVLEPPGGAPDGPDGQAEPDGSTGGRP